MATPSFNEAEVYLLSDWTSARRIEIAMGRIREKYSKLAERIVEQVRGRHRELDADFVAVTQFWGDGSLGLGRKRWGVDSNGWHTGYYIHNLRLELLTDEASDAPYAYLHVKPAVKMGLKPEAMLRAVRKCAEEGLSKKELGSWEFSEDPDEIAHHRLPFNRKELLQMLCSGDSQEFVDRVARCFDPFLKFNGILDTATKTLRK